MIFEHDMAMPELPLPVEIKSQGFFVEEGEVISTLSREWHKIAYYKLSIDEFHADGSDIACFGV
ncbi:MAG: hypothetical protein MJ200_01050 [Mycoplasmoidaceae bacterium]|nr:hypothetical protein [Mycoplasmoidaceae bacterium]